MRRFAVLMVCCALLGACNLVDMGVGRGANDWEFTGDGNCYYEYGWPANTTLLSADLFGGANNGTLISADVWRLLHVELGVLGFGLGIGPFQVGCGWGMYAPNGPAKMQGDNPFQH